MGRRRPKKRPPTHSESEDEAGVEEEDALMLPVGAEVEVRSDEPGFEDSFYEATVAGHLISRRCRRYTLAYSTLLAEEGGPLKETADAADVRPRPPREEIAGAASRGFAICEMVEAFHSDGWWAGVVSAVPPPVTGDRRHGVYEVTFPTSREIMEFEETALRPHRVFQDGRWVPAAEVDNGSPLFSEGNQVEVSWSEKNSGESWSPAIVLKVIGAHFLVQYIHIEKNEELATEFVDSEYIRPACIITRMTSRTDLSRQKEECVPFQTPDAPRESTETPKEGIAAKTTEEDNNILAIFEDLAQLPNHMMAGCEILSELNTGSCIDLTPRKYTTGSQERSEIHDLKQGGHAGETSVEQDTGEDLCQRYLIMPDDANVHFLPSEKSCEATVHDGQLCMDKAAAMAECMTGSVAPAEDLCIVSPATLDGAMPNPLQLAAKFEITESHTEVFSASSQYIEKSTVTQLSSVGMDNCAETEPGNSLAIIKYVEATLMSKYVGRITHDSRCPLSPEALGVHESIIDTNGGLSSLAIQHLPFVKTSPIWAELEALEIFSKVPQRPNFHLVQQYCPELREGMALGLMVSFANLAESINRLEIQDDNGPFEQKMLGLSLLEANGFEVRDMRLRVQTLCDTRNRRVELQDAMRKLGEKIAHKETEDRELSVEIRMLAMALHHLELHACVMRDVMRSAISQKVNNAIEISRLKTEANKLERSYVSTAVPQ
ncbi:hypothetical protein ACQ4PT_041712 [Festuca glaucescens]